MADIKEIIAELQTMKKEEVLEKLKEVSPKMWALIGGGLILLILFWIFAFTPAWSKRPVVLKQLTDIQNQMIRLKALDASKPKLEAEKKEIRELIDGFQGKLFHEDEIAFLLGKISKLALEAQVELVASNPETKPEPFPAPYHLKYRRYLYQLTVKGSYHRIADFVSRLESDQRFFQIQFLTINPAAAGGKDLMADLKLMAVANIPQTQGAKPK